MIKYIVTVLLRPLLSSVLYNFCIRLSAHFKKKAQYCFEWVQIHFAKRLTFILDDLLYSISKGKGILGSL